MNQEQKNKMNAENWIVKRNGQSFIKFAGLLWLAHQKGLTSLCSSPVFEDWEKGIFVFRAIAKGEGLHFEDEGDAAPYNVNGMIKPHIRRMASTRAMARVLRIFNGIGMSSLEEL